MRRPRFIRPYGHSALLLEWEQRIDPEINQGVHRYAANIAELAGVEECVPAYASLLVIFNRNAISAYRLKELIFDSALLVASAPTCTAHRLPVCYEPAYAPDITEISRATGLTIDEVIDRHCNREYRVYMMGYRPGFGFLGETAAELAVPRRSTPRRRVPAGSVGLAGRQTGIYPGIAPGGWQLVGRCPLTMVNERGESRLRAGDSVTFYPICQEDFRKLTGMHP